MSKDYDFSGWATKNDLQCSDGRIIGRNAFKNNDGKTVPMVWNHQHNEANNVLGHALLVNMKDGVYAYGTFNDTPSGRTAKELVEHGDVNHLSIYANSLKHNGSTVIHGDIKEVSLVLAGANPGAVIDDIIRHGELSEDEGILYTDEEIYLAHADEEDDEDEDEDEDETNTEKEKKPVANNNMTVGEKLDTFSEEDRKFILALVSKAMDDARKGNVGNDEDDEEETSEVKHNVFDTDNNNPDTVLSHSEMTAIVNDAKRYGSMKDSFLAHGIDDIEYLFPDAKTISNTPEFIKRNTDWVAKVMNSVGHTPFSRIKTIFADITEDEARARGYIKGNEKKEEVFTLLKRTTTPQTIYKKQKLDRDDVVDITDLDVISFIKGEMRIMLDEELARAILIGDGRLASSDDKIQPTNIRPIIEDEDLYTIKADLASYADYADATSTYEKMAQEFIACCIAERKNYRGSGTPTLFTTETMLTNCLLLKDKMGRYIYESPSQLATVLRVNDIITVEVMENATTTAGKAIAGLVVNLADYKVGADKGGAVNMFDDFDIDYNKMIYLIETRCSGALVKPYAAIAITYDATATASTTLNTSSKSSTTTA